MNGTKKLAAEKSRDIAAALGKVLQEVTEHILCVASSKTETQIDFPLTCLLSGQLLNACAEFNFF